MKHRFDFLNLEHKARLQSWGGYILEKSVVIEPSAFVERWREIQAKSDEPDDEKLCTASQFSTYKLSEDTKRFLKEAGLPASCSPFLSFDDVKRLPRLWEIFSPGQWEQKLKDRVAPYIMIGSDDAGNAICLDESSGGNVSSWTTKPCFKKKVSGPERNSRASNR